MAKTRPGIDRITKQQLQAEHAYATMQATKHLKTCITCKHSGVNLYGRCLTWWRLAKAEHRTARALRQYKQPETQNMDPLFTEQQCDPPHF